MTWKSAHIDPLGDCLVFLAKFHGQAYALDTLCAGLPLVDNKLTPNLFIQAASRAKLTARVVKCSLRSIAQLVLPCVAILEDNQACVILKLDHQQQTADVAFPDSGMGITTLPLEELQSRYSGFSIFVKPEYNFDNRSSEFQGKKAKSWFWEVVWQYRGEYFQLLLAALLINLFVLVSPLFVMNVYDRVIPNEAVETLWVLAIGALIAYLFDLGVKVARGYLIEASGRKIDTQLSNRLFGQLLDIKLSHKPTSPGAFASNLRDFENLRDFFTSATIVSLVDIPFVTLFLLVIYLVGGYVVLVPLLAIPVVIVVSLLIRIPLAKQTDTLMRGATQKNATVVEVISTLETIKALQAESRVQSKWQHYVNRTASSGQVARQLTLGMNNFTAWVIQLVTVLIVVVGVYNIMSGAITMGGLIASVMLGSRCLAPLAQITQLMSRYHSARLSLKGLNRIMDLPVDRPADKNFLQRPDLNGTLTFDGVSFAYPGSKIAALDNVKFSIKEGEKIAIIGKLGSGKSTLLRLILGLYTPTEGQVLIDGVDTSQIDPSNLRSNMGFLPQDATLFFGSIRENICIGQNWVDDEDLKQAAELAGILKFINKHPSGFDMPINERGENLSGGQRQAVCLARIILQEPNYILLDEPTSAMDNASEQQVLRMLNQFARDKTLILCTHKASMLKLVDRIIVVDNGRIVADGPKQQVLDKLQSNQQKVQDLQQRGQAAQ